MSTLNPFDGFLLHRQVKLQQKYAWDLENDFNWERGIDLNRFFLPLDKNNIAFPNASSEQRLALSHFMGLMVNATVYETEKSLTKLRGPVWEQVLNKYPINPEMVELGELFFIEEDKHAQAFEKYFHLFCKTASIEISDLEPLLPTAFSTQFLNRILKNAEVGGKAFWWVVASVEEASLEIFQVMRPHQNQLDPLYFQLHQRHFEEELRHANYAFLMLELYKNQSGPSLFSWRNKTDSLLGEFHTTAWILSELHKFKDISRLRGKSEFFKVLSTCLPLLESQSFIQIAKTLFLSAPYISFVLNSHHHYQTRKAKGRYKAWSTPLPKPMKVNLSSH